MAVLPTGGGKSICYQVPALMMDGICLVISPLIALINDQHQNLVNRKIKSAVIHSGISFRETELIMENAWHHAYKFLFIAPERLQSEPFLERLKHLNISFVAVDEAHCISEWGYDFRPSYLQIKEIKKQLPDIHFLALTASATSKTICDIQEKLEFPEKHLIKASFQRRNLAYVVRETENKEKKLLEILGKVQGSAIVYCPRRKDCDTISKLLTKHGIGAKAFHAGKDTDYRLKIQEQWLRNDFRVMVATNAFGMGIDKPDVRLVIHLRMPDSLEAYYQEAGRAGRDGVNSYAITLLQTYDKKELEERLLELPDFQLVKQLYQWLSNELQIAVGDGSDQSYPFDVVQFALKKEMKVSRVMAGIKVLEHEGHLLFSHSDSYRSRIQIIVEAHTLHRFQDTHPNFEQSLKTLLRSYSGIMDHEVYIDEQLIAKRIGIEKDKLIEKLKTMHQYGIVSYHEKSQKRKIQWLLPRVAVKHFTLRKETIERIHHITKEQIRQAIGYLTATTCRSQYLLEYFDEHTEKTCGVCDICRAKKGKDVESAHEDLQEAILELINPDADLKYLQNKLPYHSYDAIIIEIRELLDQGKIQEIETNKFTKLTR